MKNLILFVIVLLSGCCNSENPFISEEHAKEILKANELKPVKDVAFILNNDVYFLRDFNQEPRKITNSGSVIKRHVRFSHDHSKIAYLNSDGSPVIIDTLGVVKQQLTSFTNVKQMEWTIDNKSLYMLIDNQIVFSGNSLNIPTMEIESNEDILSAIITIENSVIYIVQTPTASTGFYYRIVNKKLNGETKIIHSPTSETRQMKSLRLSRDGNYFTIGYKYSSYTNYSEKVEVYSLDGETPVFVYESEECIDAVYDNSSRFIVMAAGNAGFSTNPFYLKALYTLNKVGGEDKSKYKLNYSGHHESIYVDWK